MFHFCQRRDFLRVESVWGWWGRWWWWWWIFGVVVSCRTSVASWFHRDHVITWPHCQDEEVNHWNYSNIATNFPTQQEVWSALTVGTLYTVLPSITGPHVETNNHSHSNSHWWSFQSGSICRFIRVCFKKRQETRSPRGRPRSWSE